MRPDYHTDQQFVEPHFEHAARMKVSLGTIVVACTAKSDFSRRKLLIDYSELAFHTTVSLKRILYPVAMIVSSHQGVPGVSSSLRSFARARSVT
jgi:hypothetical protein